MATVNKDFKIKQGLVVEGTTATVAGNNILVENTQGTDSYITNLVGGVAYIKSVSSDFGVDLAGELTINGSSDLARTGDITSALVAYTTTNDLDSTISGYGYITGAALNGYATESYVGMQGYITLNSLSAGNGIDFNQGIISVNYGDGITLGQLNEIKVNIGSGIALGASNELTVDFTGYVTETGQQTLTNKTIGDTLNFTGAGDMTINSDSHIVLTPAVGSSVKWGADALATQTYANDAVTSHNNLTTGVHGVDGDVVGTSDQQILTNKTIADNLTISDGQTSAGTIGATQDGKLAINASQTLYLHSDNANIELVPGQGSSVYINGTSAGNEVATHSYVDNAISGLDWKQSVNLLSNANVSDLTDTTLTIDGHSVDSNHTGYRILLTSQTTDSENGIYEVVNGAFPGTISLSRPADADAYTELIGAAVYVMEGTTYGGSSWVQGDHYLTDFTGQDWTQFSGAGTVTAGTGIVVNGLQVSVDTSIIATQENLTDGLALKQDTLTAGDNIGIINGTISVTGLDTDDVAENIGATNLYYTDARVESVIDTSVAINGTIFNAINSAVSTKANAANPTLTGSLTLDGTGDFTITSDSNIVLDPNTTAYLNSAIAGNEIATEGYVDDAIAGVTVDYAAMAGTYLDWSGTQFNVDAASLITTEDLATNTSVGTDITTAIDALTTADIEEFAGVPGVSQPGPFYFTDQRAIDAIAGANITPNTVTIDTYRKEEATQQYVANASTVNVHAPSSGFESVKYLVRVVGNVTGTKHSQITEILMTIDGNQNIAITEYGNIYTSENPLATFSAAMVGPGAFAVPTLTATTAVNGCEIIAAATMLSWAD